LPVGSRTITASFTDSSPSGNFAPSSGQLTGYIVSPASTSTSVSAIPASSAIYGQTVSLTATVTSPTGTPPTGVGSGSSVAFFDLTTGTPLGSADLVAGGTATLNVNTLTVGTHTIRATYTDTFDGNFTGSSGNLVGYTISKASTNTALAANPASGAVFSQVVTLTATVTSPTGTPPLGAGSTVVFVDVTTGTTLGSADLTAGGIATLQTSVLTVGTHQITATYTDSTPASNFNGSVGAINNYGVSSASTAITAFNPVVPSPSAGQTVTLSATASTVFPATGIVDAGSITFMDVTVPGSPITLGVANVNASGVATITTSFSSPGDRTISAQYNGANPRFNASPIATMTQPVRKVSSVNVSPVANVMYGQTVTFAVTVSGSPGTPTGTITVTDQLTSTNYGPFTLSGGAVSIPIANLIAGSHSMVFTYSGDTSPAPGFGISSTTITQVIAPANTSATTTPSSGSSIFGQTVTFNATITGATGINPTTGVVGFYDNFGGAMTLLGTGTLSGTNSTSFTTTATQLAAGTHSVMAIYAGSANFAVSPFSSPRTQTVAKASTQTTLAATSPSFYGNTVTFTATVTATSPGSPGSLQGNPVAFMDGSTLLGYAQVNGSGVATFTTTATQLAVGNHSITATNLGTANFAASAASAPRTQTVNAAGTQTTLVSSHPGGSVYGNPVTFTASVAVTTGGNPGTPPGYIIFFDGANNLGTVAMTNGSASITVSNLAAGSHTTLRAYYAPSNSNFVSTASAYLTQNVAGASTSTTLRSSVTYWAVNQPVTFTATVAATSGGNPGTPTGSVQFNIDGTLITVPLSGNTASTTFTFTTMGNHTVTATYLPANANFQTSASAAQTQNVRKDSAVTLSSASDVNTVALGALVTTNAAGGPPTGTVTFYEYFANTNTYQPLGTATLSNGRAVIFADLAQGNHVIVITYSGDTNFNPAVTAGNVSGKTGGRVV
jgi:hypothetical protein